MVRAPEKFGNHCSSQKENNKPATHSPDAKYDPFIACDNNSNVFKSKAMERPASRSQRKKELKSQMSNQDYIWLYPL